MAEEKKYGLRSAFSADTTVSSPPAAYDNGKENAAIAEKKSEPQTDSNGKTDPTAPATATGGGDNKKPPSTLAPDDMQWLSDSKPEYIETKYGIADSDLKKLGFLTAVELADDPTERYKKLLDTHRQAIEQIRRESEELANKEKGKYYTLMRKGEGKIDEIKTELTDYGTTISDKEREKITLKDDLRQVKEEIFRYYQQLMAKRKSYIGERMVEVQGDLKKLMDSQSELYADKDGYLKGYAGAGKTIAEQTAARVHKIILAFEKRFDEIQLFVQAFDRHGVSYVSYNALINFGYSLALIAGLFFAITLNPTGDSAGNLIEDVIDSILIFFERYQWWGLPIILALLVGFTLVSWLTDTLRRSYYHYIQQKKRERILSGEEDESSVQEAFSFSLEGGKSLGLNFSIKADSLLFIWLQVLPFLLFVITVVFFLSFKYSGKAGPKYNLDKTTVGVIVALVLACLMYIVIARRYRNEYLPKPAEDKLRRWWDRDWELQFLMWALAVWNVILLIIYAAHATNAIALTQELIQFISLGEYLLITLLCAVCLGYGLYLRSMTTLADDLEQYLHYLHSLQWSYYQSVPSLYYTNIFGKTYRDLQLQLLTVLGRKINPYFPLSEADTIKVKSNNSLLNSIRRLLSRKKDESIKPDLLSVATVLEDDDKRLYPDLSEKLSTLEKEKAELEEKIKAIDSESAAYHSRSAERYIALIKRMDLVSEYIDGWRNAILQIERKLQIEGKHLRRQAIKERVILMDGYHLGIWHRENNLGPSNDYYQKTGYNANPEI